MKTKQTRLRYILVASMALTCSAWSVPLVHPAVVSANSNASYTEDEYRMSSEILDAIDEVIPVSPRTLHVLMSGNRILQNDDCRQFMNSGRAFAIYLYGTRSNIIDHVSIDDNKVILQLNADLPDAVRLIVGNGGATPIQRRFSNGIEQVRRMSLRVIELKMRGDGMEWRNSLSRTSRLEWFRLVDRSNHVLESPTLSRVEIRGRDFNTVRLTFNGDIPSDAQIKVTSNAQTWVGGRFNEYTHPIPNF